MSERQAIWRQLLHNRPAAVAAVGIAAFAVAALAAPQLAPHDPEAGDLAQRLLPPVWSGGQWSYPLGCDQHGRDVLSRLLYGARVTTFIGLIVVSASAAIGTGLGLLAGYLGRWWDRLVCWVVDTLLAFPYLVFAIGLMAMLGPGLLNIIVTLTLKGWVPFCRVVRGDTMAIKGREHVEAAKGVGAGSGYILLREILPNVLPSVFVLATLNVATVVIMEASLSFLGLGVQPPTPTWGGMIAEGRDYLLDQWWCSTLPGVALAGLVLSVNVFGEGLREALDPRLRA
jgi:ABC-type dipeptide/oligopeptide/nickel transport system permease subunit